MSYSRRILTLTLALGLAAAAPEAGATVPADLCTGDPCTVTADKVVDGGSDLDFGDADLVLAPGVDITIAGTPATLILRAGSITLQQTANITTSEASVTLISTLGNITLQSSGTSRSEINVQGLSGGSIALDAAANAVIGGRLNASGSGGDSAGGSISISAGGTVSNSETIAAGASGSFSFGGEISIAAGTGVTLNAPIDLAAGGSDGGFLEITATTGDVVINALVNTSGGDPDGEGGPIDILADAGKIQVNAGGELRGRGGAGPFEDCGDGAEVNLTAATDITLSGPIVNRAGLHCFGGEITMVAGGNLLQQATAPIDAFGPGGFGGGGGFTAEIAGNATFNADVGMNSAGFGGLIDITALGSVAINDLMTAAATGVADAIAGEINVQACNLVVGPSGDVDARGNLPLPGFGVVRLRSGGPLLVQGRVRAADRVELRHKVVLPSVTGPVSPAPLIIEDPTLPDCATLPLCGDGTVNGSEVCDDGDNVSCDGCQADCTRNDAICGDSVQECGEQCDDGNEVGGDGCEADCTLPALDGVRLPGAIKNVAGCLVEWDVKLADPVVDAKGFPKSSQDCIDGDPRCDADLTKDGNCEIEVKACARVPDARLPACVADPIAHIEILHPKPGAGTDMFNLMNATALRDALLGLGGTVKVGTSNIQTGPPIEGVDVCTEPFRLVAPHRTTNRPDTRRLRIAAVDTKGLEMGYNAFRVFCFRNNAVCGNGLIEIGESCEDGNTDSCDGCSAQCRVESCGNGIVECNESCDDGPLNGTPNSECTAMCTEAVPELRIGGGGPASKDCAWQWSMIFDPEKVALDRKGAPRNRQTCTDNDTSCDLDPTVGRCRFRIYGCVGEENAALGCSAAVVSSATIKAPRAKTKFGHEQLARTALMEAVTELGLPKGPSAPAQTCRAFEVDLPATRRALTLKVQSIFGDGVKDTDSLKLRCVTP